MSVLVDLSPRAHREAARIAHWWRANRPSAPDLFDQELHVVLMQIATAPNSGIGVRGKGEFEHRRLVMPATRYYVYWRNLTAQRATVVAIWNAVRGRGPAL